jgi:hypothetical protein
MRVLVSSTAGTRGCCCMYWASRACCADCRRRRSGDAGVLLLAELRPGPDAAAGWNSCRCSAPPACGPAAALRLLLLAPPLRRGDEAVAARFACPVCFPAGDPAACVTVCRTDSADALRSSKRSARC